MNMKSASLLQYLLIYPLYNVLGMVFGTAILYFLFSWSLEYAKAFFMVSSVFLVGVFYVLNFRAIISIMVTKSK
ncbi:hypothetical protein P20495_0133 [Pseudoalteromonas sp. BSi20495]|nr:hypothetical protein P20495_0133 [Pseudoalteromonas sp. BSi20495]